MGCNLSRAQKRDTDAAFASAELPPTKRARTQQSPDAASASSISGAGSSGGSHTCVGSPDTKLQQEQQGSVVRYLPMVVDGKTVLVHEPGTDLYRADNSQIQASTRQLGYRLSTNLTDMDGTRGLPWGQKVECSAAGKGWVAVRVSDDRVYACDKARKEAEAAKAEAKAKAKKEAEEKARKEVEAAKADAEAKAKRDAEENAKKEVPRKENGAKALAEAKASFDAAIRASNEAHAIKKEGNNSFKAGEYREALTHYNRALEKIKPYRLAEDPRASLYLNVAFCYLRLRSDLEAKEACDKALSIEPKNVKGLWRRGLAHFELQNFSEACSDINEADALDPQGKITGGPEEIKQLKQKIVKAEAEAKATKEAEEKARKEAKAAKADAEAKAKKEATPTGRPRAFVPCSRQDGTPIRAA